MHKKTLYTFFCLEKRKCLTDRRMSGCEAESEVIVCSTRAPRELSSHTSPFPQTSPTTQTLAISRSSLMTLPSWAVCLRERAGVPFSHLTFTPVRPRRWWLTSVEGHYLTQPWTTMGRTYRQWGFQAPGFSPQQWTRLVPQHRWPLCFPNSHPLWTTPLTLYTRL